MHPCDLTCWMQLLYSTQMINSYAAASGHHFDHRTVALYTHNVVWSYISHAQLHVGTHTAQQAPLAGTTSPTPAGPMDADSRYQCRRSCGVPVPARYRILMQPAAYSLVTTVAALKGAIHPCLSARRWQWEVLMGYVHVILPQLWLNL